MHAHRAHTPRKLRLGAGLAAAAVFTAGLSCSGAATAAPLADFPSRIDFEVRDLVTTADEAYVAGYRWDDANGDWSEQFTETDGYVEAAGSGATVHLGPGTQPFSISASPDGGTLHVLGQQLPEVEDDATVPLLWTIDAATMTVSDEQPFEPGSYADALATGADGTYVAGSDESGGTVTLLGGDPVGLGQDVQPFDIAVTSSAAGADVVVAATHFQEAGASMATLASVSVEGAVTSTVLGPDGSHDDFAISMDVDEVNGLTYVITVRDVEDGPQEYGLNVIGPDTDLYVPLPDPASSVVVSPDGETVYLSASSVSAYDADALDSYDEENYPPSTYLGGSGWVQDAGVDETGRLYVVQEQEDEETGDTATWVHALEAPGAPTGLQAVAAEWAADTLLASWVQPASLGGAPEDSLGYRVTLQDDAGGDPVVNDVWMPEAQFYDLETGHTYTLSVATTNGVFTSAPATTTFTVGAGSLEKPSAVAVNGTATVGSHLSVVTANGEWEDGTTLTYAWRTDRGTVVSRSATMTLTSAHLGRRVQVVVTGTRGDRTGSLTSAYSAQVAPGTLSTRTPKIKGKAKVRKTLKAVTGSWTAGTRLRYRWTADGRTIKGATKRSFKLTSAVAGKQVRVVVTGTQAGYKKATRTSKATAKVKR